ncbi:uncharacterized membrane protein YraQ (UPF0718 family) [Ereboglobus sp. PH5-10]|uniref:permease n=1 Tax=Ereboglobus sp. PH5-10 TaxID=2940629 RepID=UPI00240492E9|nr:permease [Ereboglobus sp. PH5-10]MDF9827373.1 uncharacterized membrane protein YraQ (UPF0718 family) [Ereboglobus sp. PH5-10]
MNKLKETKTFLLMAGVFAAFYFLPSGWPRFDLAIREALELAKWYAREHVILCLLPAFWIAGAIGAFVSQQSVMRYLGPKAPKALSYGVASVSGTILAVCSCTVLPLFSGIYRMGAGLGPASAFLYSGPAINALAIIMTAKVLGFQIGVARAVGAVVFSIVIGILMHLLFRKEEQAKAAKIAALPEAPATRPLWKTAAFFATMVGILVFANWSRPPGGESGFFAVVFSIKWPLTALLAAVLGVMLWRWFKLSGAKLAVTGIVTAASALLLPAHPEACVLAAIAGLVWATAGRDGEAGEWFDQSWTFAKQIFPLLIGGVLVAGLLLGRPGHEGLIPSEWIMQSVGGNSFFANAFAGIAGAFMYFATLTEVPILQGLIGNGMGEGPALTLLLAGPALSLPSMIVINSVLGLKKTAAYIGLVIVLSTLAGWGYGAIFG